MEFGQLTAPFAELRQATLPTHRDYRLALAKVQAGDPAWRETLRAFATFANDLFMRDQFTAVCVATEQFWKSLRKRVLINKTDLQWVKREYDPLYDAYVAQILELVSEVPVDWEPEIFEANTPFTAYLRIRQAFAAATGQLTYIDRYLSGDFFRLFLNDVGRTVSITLVTTPKAVKAVEAISALACKEFAKYRLVEVAPIHFHDRNLIVDGQAFTLGPGVDRAGLALTNFGPSDSSAGAIGEFDRIIAAGRLVHHVP
jgi:hypothetical protein